MRKDSEKPELQWVEDLLDQFAKIAGEVVLGLIMTVVAISAAIIRCWFDDPPPPSQT